MSTVSKKLEAHFDLSDIDNMASSNPGKGKLVIHAPNPIPSQTRIKSVAKKRKTTTAADDNLFEGLSIGHAIAVLGALMDQCVTQVGTREGLLIKELEDTKKALVDA